jgi:hypothetical protein
VTDDGDQPLRVRVVEPHLDPRAHDPVRSYAVEWHWLPVVGPTALWVARRIVLLVDAHVPEDDGPEVWTSYDQLGAAVGVTADRAHHAMRRLARFQVGAYLAPDLFALASRWPPAPEHPARGPHAVVP